MPLVALNPSRRARWNQAFDEMWDAREAGDQAAFEGRAARLVDLDRRLHLEQLAELGYLPPTLRGCVVVLELAARIAESLGAAA